MNTTTGTSLYPIGLRVHGKRCLVVGAGPVAARKAEGLAACGALVTVVAPEVSAEMRDLAGRSSNVDIHTRTYDSGEGAGYQLVITATDDGDVNATVHADAEAAGVWVNSADDPDRCSFFLPAVHRHDPVVVAVSTGGTSPALAAWLRDRIAAVVTAEHAQWAQRLSATRQELHAQGRSTESLPWRDLLDAQTVEDDDLAAFVGHQS